MSSEDSGCDQNDDLGTRKLTKSDKAVIRTANELLESLEQTHRNDLALHLYSTYLLKHLLRAANRKHSQLETDVFIKTQIKDNWTSWPNPYTVIDPKTNKIFEDFHDDETEEVINAGEISAEGLKHASEMLNLEIDAIWQRLLSKSAAKYGNTLDVDRMRIPRHCSSEILNKLDHFFEGLHNKVAQLSKLELSQTANSTRITLSKESKNHPIHMNKKIKLNYRDIISQGCQMGEDMSSIYMKSLELYNDIPSRFRKSPFKLNKSELQKYATKPRGEANCRASKKLRNEYISIKKLIKERRLTFETRNLLRKVQLSQSDFLLDKKTFYVVRGYENDGDTAESSIEIKDYLVDTDN